MRKTSTSSIILDRDGLLVEKIVQFTEEGFQRTLAIYGYFVDDPTELFSIKFDYKQINWQSQ